MLAKCCCRGGYAGTSLKPDRERGFFGVVASFEEPEPHVTGVITVLFWCWWEVDIAAVAFDTFTSLANRGLRLSTFITNEGSRLTYFFVRD